MIAIILMVVLYLLMGITLWANWISVGTIKSGRRGPLVTLLFTAALWPLVTIVLLISKPNK